MGDRCYVQLTLCGPVTSTGSVHEICEAIASMGFDGVDEHSGNVLEEIAAAVLAGRNPSFEMQECNYGDISDVEVVLQIERVSYYIDQGSGDSYPAAVKAWAPDRGEYEFTVTDDGVMVDIDTLRKLLVPAKGTARKLRQIIADADFANGRDMPPFSVPEKLMRSFARRAAARALKIGENVG